MRDNYYYDTYGRLQAQAVKDQIKGMSSPVECVCGEIYDMGRVEVITRYTDCSAWRAPCCGRLTDDRPRWNGSQDSINAGRKL